MTGHSWRWARLLVWHWLPLLAWMALIFFLSAQPDLPHPESGLAGWLFSSAAHALFFGVLAVLWVRAFDGTGWRHPLFLAFLATVLYSLSDEFHQMFVPGRHADVWDLACDAGGALLALGPLAWWQRHLAARGLSSPAGEPRS